MKPEILGLTFVLAFAGLITWMLWPVLQIKRIRREYAVLTKLFEDSVAALKRGDVKEFERLEAEHQQMSEAMSAKYGYKV